jgi:hypothetical protein
MPTVKTRHLSAKGKAAISRAAKERWRKWRKTHPNGAKRSKPGRRVRAQRMFHAVPADGPFVAMIERKIDERLDRIFGE